MAWFGVERVSDTEIEVELGFDGNIDTDSTLTFTVGAGAIEAYDGPALTAQVSVPVSAEQVPAADVPNPPQQETAVDKTDLLIIVDNLDDSAIPAAPARREAFAAVSPETLQMWLNLLRPSDDGSVVYHKTLAILQGLLAAAHPHETALLSNYPNGIFTFLHFALEGYSQTQTEQSVSLKEQQEGRTLLVAASTLYGLSLYGPGTAILLDPESGSQIALDFGNIG